MRKGDMKMRKRKSRTGKQKPFNVEKGSYQGTPRKDFDKEVNSKARTGKFGPNEGASTFKMKNSGQPERAERDVMYAQFEKRYFKELAYAKTIQVQPHPNQEMAVLADPYAVINRLNQVYDAKYPEEENVSGNVVQQLARSSNSSFQEVADCIRLRLKMNYNYAKLTNASKAPSSINDQIQNVWLEAQSTFQSQAFYQLPFFKWLVTRTSATGSGANLPLQFSDPLLDAVYFYQTFIQVGYSIAQTFRKMMSMRKELMDSTFYKGSQKVGFAYGLLDKGSFRNTINQINKGLASNFTDEAWLDQVATVFLTPSRKSKSMIEPIQEVVVNYEYNDNLTIRTSEPGVTPAVSFNTSLFTPFFLAAAEFSANLSASEILRMARTDAVTIPQITVWFNNLVANAETMLQAVNTFNDKFADLNTAFTRMWETGLTQWQKGVFIDIDDINQNFEPQYNVMIEDIYRSIFSGSSEITYSADFQEWVMYELNDEFVGIPRYSQRVGGAFLTFSTKTVTGASGAPSNIMYPVMFSFQDCLITRRSGGQLPVSQLTQTINTSPELGRVLSVGNMDMKTVFLPSIDTTSISSNKGKGWTSFLLMRLVGWYSNKVSATATQLHVSPTKLCLVDVLQADVTNKMLNYIRLTAPFRVVKTETKTEIGFVI